VFELLEGRVVIGRQHFPVGINVHACPFGLLEKFFHVFEIVARDQDAGVFPNPDVDFRDLWIAVCRRVGLVKKRHGIYRHLSGFHDHRDHFIR